MSDTVPEPLLAVASTYHGAVMSENAPDVPTMPGWTLALRFLLELAALAGLAMLAWEVAPEGQRWLAALVLSMAGAMAWGLFNVPDDPSRSGKAPVAVPGLARLALELALLFGGAVGWLAGGQAPIGLVLVALILFHYATTIPRVRWLLKS